MSECGIRYKNLGTGEWRQCAKPSDHRDRCDGPVIEPAPVSGFPNIPDLVQQWEAAAMRTFRARSAGEGAADPADYLAELRLGAQISREVLAGRWVVVAELLRLGAVESWSRLAEVLDMTAPEARGGFRSWISGQRDLYRGTGSLGLTEAEADELQELAEAVTW